MKLIQVWKRRPDASGNTWIPKTIFIYEDELIQHFIWNLYMELYQREEKLRCWKLLPWIFIPTSLPQDSRPPTWTNKNKIKQQSIITPSHSGQELKSATVIQGKKRSFGDCTQSTGYGGLKSRLPSPCSVNHFMDHIAGNILALIATSFSVYGFCTCCAPVWELREDGRLYSR